MERLLKDIPLSEESKVAFPSHETDTGSDASRRCIWSIGSGKGGVGKTLLSVNMGVQISREGGRVLLVDADLGGANLHTFLGMLNPKRTLGDFISKKISNIDEIINKTPIPGLSFISGSGDYLGIANLFYTQKLRFLKKLKSLEGFDYIILDIGAGTSFNVIDFSLLSDDIFLVVIPEAISIENAYRFLKAVFFRKLRQIARRNMAVKIIDEIIKGKSEDKIKFPYELIQKVSEIDGFLGNKIKQEISCLRIGLILNQVRVKEDVQLGYSMKNVCGKYFGLDLDYLGYVEYDSALWKTLRNDSPVLINSPDSRIARCIRQVAKRAILLKD